MTRVNLEVLTAGLIQTYTQSHLEVSEEDISNIVNGTYGYFFDTPNGTYFISNEELEELRNAKESEDNGIIQ